MIQDTSAWFPVKMQAQPDDTTCGPTCLHAVYGHYGDRIGLEQVIREVPVLHDGGTLAVFLACHALRRGYDATIYTYNLQVFDPIWFQAKGVNIREKLIAQAQAKTDAKLEQATTGYLEFLELGGIIRFEDLTPRLLSRSLAKGCPILTGLSATYLYHSPRERGPDWEEDDIGGIPVGHFVVLCGYDRATRQVMVADPLQESPFAKHREWGPHPNPVAEDHVYTLPIERVLGAMLLGILTYDANLLILVPRRGHGAARHD